MGFFVVCVCCFCVWCMVQTHLRWRHRVTVPLQLVVVWERTISRCTPYRHRDRSIDRSKPNNKPPPPQPQPQPQPTQRSRSAHPHRVQTLHRLSVPPTRVLSLPPAQTLAAAHDLHCIRHNRNRNRRSPNLHRTNSSRCSSSSRHSAPLNVR